MLDSTRRIRWEWNEMEWNGMEWNGMKWMGIAVFTRSGVRYYKPSPEPDLQGQLSQV